MKKYTVLIFAIAVLVFALFAWDSPIPHILPEEVLAESVLAESAEEDFGLFDKSGLALVFSETGHFFPDGVVVEITASNPYARIYYTLDGSIPTTNSNPYFHPLDLGFMWRYFGEEAVVLRAIAAYGGEVSRIFTHTYFISPGVDTRFTTLVFSLSTTPDYLFCHYTGILVPGITRENFIRDNPGTHINPTAPANFNWRGFEGERPINVEVITEDGTRIISQQAGVRVFGAWSRGYDQRSLRLVARREYEPELGRFNFDLFPGDIINDGFDTPLKSYNALILRNGANDRHFGMMRNEVGSVLARNAGFVAVTPVRPAAVFLNGEYYGFMWLQVRVDNHYLSDLFNAPTRNFDIINSGEWWFTSGSDEAREDIVAKNMFAFEDLTNDTIFAQLEEIVDIDNLLFYYAFQIFMGNEDWPHNNVRRWRYTGETIPGTYLDGRWRYAFFDLDWTLGLYGDNYRKPTLENVLTGREPRSQILSAILQRDDMAERFTIIMCDIASNVVTGELVLETGYYLFTSAMHEIYHALMAGKYAGWVGFHTIWDNHINMVNFATYRHTHIFRELARFFEFDNNMYTVNIIGGEAIIGTQRGTTARYFNHLTVPVYPVLPPHTEFYHWLIHGHRVYNPNILVSLANAYSGVVNLELVTRPAFPPLVFYNVHTTPYGNGIILINPSDEQTRTNGLFLSNTPDDLFLWQLPTAIIPAGNTLELAGRSSRASGDVFRIPMNFNVRDNRRFFLSDEHGNILDSFFLPRS